MEAANYTKDRNSITFEHIWSIKNWGNVIRDESLIQNSYTENRCIADNFEYAKYIFGLNIFDFGSKRRIGFYFKLLSKHDCLGNNNIKLAIADLNKDGTIHLSYKSTATAEVGSLKEIKEISWEFPTTDNVTPYTNVEGSWVVRIQITLPIQPERVYCFEIEKFLKVCTDELIENWTSLLDDKAGSDVKILTKDNMQLFAHKTVLRARCPVFASMFGSDFLESSTGIIKVGDISAKTMKILLRYWYTGKLLPIWQGADIVAEFTYAAGKYQITHILKMLDDVLGRNFKSSDADVDLLRVVQQLSLKNAETRMLRLVVNQISQANSGAELLDITPLEMNNLDVDKFSVLEVLTAFDDVLSESIDKPACSYDITLMGLACKHGMKNVEAKLLNRIIGTVNKMSNAAELFSLFDIQLDDGSKDRDLLVRVLPT